MTKYFVGIYSMLQKTPGIENLMHDRGVTTFRRNFFVSQCQNFRGHPFNVPENLGYRKTFCLIGGIKLLCRNFFVSPCRKFLYTNPTVFERISRFEKFLRMKKWGIIFFRRETLVSRSQKISWASLQCFRKIVVSEIFMYNRGYHVFCQKFWVAQCRKKIVGIPSILWKIGVIEIFMHKRGYHVIPLKVLCLTVPKYFVGIPSMFQKILGVENFMHDRGVTTFRRKFFVSQWQKISCASLHCYRKLVISKNFMHNRGYHVFLSKCFCLTLPKLFVSESCCFRENF